MIGCPLNPYEFMAGRSKNGSCHCLENRGYPTGMEFESPTSRQTMVPSYNGLLHYLVTVKIGVRFSVEPPYFDHEDKLAESPHRQCGDSGGSTHRGRQKLQ